jgi:hypothetical protein
MDCNFMALESFSERITDYLVPCAIRLKAPDIGERVPTHFILLLDVSDSMKSDNKLENVKRCTENVLQILTEKDRISLITFGYDATLHLNRVIADEAHKVSMRDVIKGLDCNGCTNLSAGLVLVRQICQGEEMKTGLLVLTDGHANMGVHEPNALRKIFQNLSENISVLSINCIAYGSDHNADLLKNIAEDSQGTYTIVNTIEDTAMAFGDTLGGLLSCASQNNTVTLPKASKVYGYYKCETKDDVKIVKLGDIYSGTSPLLLADIPAGQLRNNTDCVIVKGTKLPEFTEFIINPKVTLEPNRQIDIEATKLRYKCTEILNDLKNWGTLDTSEKLVLEARIKLFETLLNDTFYNDNVLISLLKSEVNVMKDTLKRCKEGNMNNFDNVMVSQHITTLGLGRGFSSPMPVNRRRRHNTLEEPDENPTVITSAFQNTMQSQISELLRTSSQYHP